MESKPWESASIGEALARELITCQLPEIPLKSLLLLGEGWDNTTFLVNNEIVFRFPRKQAAVVLLLNEINLLPYIQNQVRYPIPVPKFIGKPADNYLWPFAGYYIVNGATADSLDLSRQQRCALASNIAGFIASVHHINAEEVKKLGAPFDLIGRVDVEVRRPKTLILLDKLEQLQLLEVTQLRQFMLEFNPAPRKPKLCVTHGDLYARHLILNPQQQLAGIIDWGDMHIGDPAVDLAIAHTFLPPEAHEEFKKQYGGIDDATWELAKFRGVYSCAIFTVYAHDVNDAALLREGLLGLGFINETLG